MLYKPLEKLDVIALETAERTLQGYEVMHMLRKGHVREVSYVAAFASSISFNVSRSCSS